MKPKNRTAIIFVIIAIVYAAVCALYFRTKAAREERGRQALAIVDKYSDRVKKLKKEKEDADNEQEIKRINSELNKLYDDFFKDIRQMPSEN